MQSLLPKEPRTCKNALCGLGGFVSDIGTGLDSTDECKILIFLMIKGMAPIQSPSFLPVSVSRVCI